MPTGLGLRPGAKAPDEPPNPTGYAPPLDSTCPYVMRGRGLALDGERSALAQRLVERAWGDVTATRYSQKNAVIYTRRQAGSEEREPSDIQSHLHFILCRVDRHLLGAAGAVVAWFAGETHRDRVRAERLRRNVFQRDRLAPFDFRLGEGSQTDRASVVACPVETQPLLSIR